MLGKKQGELTPSLTFILTGFWGEGWFLFFVIICGGVLYNGDSQLIEEISS